MLELHPNIYIYTQSRPWAHISRSLGGHISYRCCFLQPMSTVILLLYIIALGFILRVIFLLVFVFARMVHSTSQLAMTIPSKCVTHVGLTR